MPIGSRTRLRVASISVVPFCKDVRNATDGVRPVSTFCDALMPRFLPRPALPVPLAFEPRPYKYPDDGADYAHLVPSHVAQVIRAMMPKLGLV